MNAKQALDTLWEVIDEAGSFYESFDPDDQLEPEEVKDGLTTRLDRHDLNAAEKALTAFLSAAEDVNDAFDDFGLEGYYDYDAREALNARRSQALENLAEALGKED